MWPNKSTLKNTLSRLPGVILGVAIYSMWIGPVIERHRSKQLEGVGEH